MKFRFNHVSKSVLSALILSAGMSVSASVLAAEQATPGANAMPHSGQPAQHQLTAEQQATLTELKGLQQALQTTQQSLQKIQQKAFEKNPQFEKKREALQTALFKKMSSKDYDAKAEVKYLQSMVTKYQDGKAKPTQEEVVTFRKREQAFQEHQQKASQDAELQKMSAALKKEVEAKMISIDPKTKTLMKELETKSKKFMELRQKLTGM